MNVKPNVILLINSKNRISKQSISSQIGIKETYVQGAVRWFNSFSSEKVLYDNSGYFFEKPLSSDQVKSLKKHSTLNNNILVIFELLSKSLVEDINIKQKFYSNGVEYNVSTLNSSLTYIKLPRVNVLLEMNMNMRLYYCSILPLYYSEGEDFITEEYLNILSDISQYDFTKNKKKIYDELNKLEVKNLNILSNHSRLALSTLYSLICLIDNKTEFPYKSITILGFKFSIPAQIDSKVFNSLFVLETDFLYNNLEILKVSDIKKCIEIIDQIEFLDLHYGYLEPCINNFPLLNPAITILCKEYSKSIFPSYLIEKIICIFIAIWLRDVDQALSYEVKSMNEVKSPDYCYKTLFSKIYLVLKKSELNEVYRSDNLIFFEYTSVKSLFEIAQHMPFNNTKIQSLEHFNISFTYDVPEYFIIDCLKTLEINYPNITVDLQKDKEIIKKSDNIYSFIANANYNTFPYVKKKNNYMYDDIINLIKR